jgi:type II secretion system protein G
MAGFLAGPAAQAYDHGVNGGACAVKGNRSLAMSKSNHAEMNTVSRMVALAGLAVLLAIVGLNAVAAADPPVSTQPSAQAAPAAAAPDAKMARAMQELSNMRLAVCLFETENGRFPTTAEGLAALVKNPGNMPGWKQLLEKVPTDPWGRPYVYRSPGTNGVDLDFELYSTGPSGQDRVAGASAPQERQVGEAKQQMSAIRTALDVFEIDNGRYPTTAEGLAALVKNPGNLPNWVQSLDKLPNDPWGHPYVYHVPGANGADFDLYSTGPSGQDGAADNVRP